MDYRIFYKKSHPQTVIHETYDNPPVGPYELIDRECQAMKLFVTDCPYDIQKRDLLIARKAIHKHEMLFKEHRFI